MKAYLGIDWGGTYIKAGIIDAKGNIKEKKVFTSNDLRHPKAFVSSVKKLVKCFDRYDIQAVGIGAPGIINVDKGFIYYLPNIPGWKNYPLKKTLERAIKRPVFINNDANIFALAEARLGAAKDVSRALFLTLRTGLGGAVIYNKRILEGTVSASEVGHVPVSLKGRKCGCGGFGCIETFVGNKYLLKRYNQLKKTGKKATEVKEIFQRASRGEKQALQVWEEFSNALGMFLAGMINIFNLQKIIFGGGVSGAFSVFKPLVWKWIKSHTMWPLLKDLKLVKAQLKDPGIIGAGLLAKESLNG